MGRGKGGTGLRDRWQRNRNRVRDGGEGKREKMGEKNIKEGDGKREWEGEKTE